MFYHFLCWNVFLCFLPLPFWTTHTVFCNLACGHALVGGHKSDIYWEIICTTRWQGFPAFSLALSTQSRGFDLGCVQLQDFSAAPFCDQITKEEKGSLSALWIHYIFISTCLIHPVDQVDIGLIARSDNICPLHMTLHISLLESYSLTAFSTTKAQWTLLFMVTKFSNAHG